MTRRHGSRLCLRASLTVGSLLALTPLPTIAATTVVVAAVPDPAFVGSFESPGLQLSLSFDGATSRYLGSLTEKGRTAPIDAAIRTIGSNASLDGVIVVDAIPRPFRATSANGALRITRSSTTNVLTRTSTQPPTATPFGAGDPAPSSYSRAANNELFGSPPQSTAVSANGGAGAGSPVAKQGIRFTYLFGTATIPGLGPALVPDPSGTGGWVDPKTGQGYKEETATGTGSLAYRQVTITDVGSAGSVVSDERTLLIDLNERAVTVGTQTGNVGTVAAGGVYWLAPATLAQMADGTEGGLTVRRLPYPLLGKTFRAIRLIEPANNGYVQRTYDLDTGMLLVYGSSFLGSDVLQPGPDGTATSGQGAKTIVSVMLQNVRQMRLPWFGERAPQSITDQRTIDWSGTSTITIDGAYAVTSRVSQRWDVERTDPAWMQVRETKQTVPQYSAPSVETTQRTFPISTLWIDPTILGRLQQGQKLDEDRITGLTLSVVGRQNGSLLIQEAGPILRSTEAYDLRTGQLTAYQVQSRKSPGTTTEFFQRTS